jgi:hypothetical protein
MTKLKTIIYTIGFLVLTAFDEKKGEGWHNGWKSSRGHAQRAVNHVLRVICAFLCNNGISYRNLPACKKRFKLNG